MFDSNLCDQFFELKIHSSEQSDPSETRDQLLEDLKRFKSKRDKLRKVLDGDELPDETETTNEFENKDQDRMVVDEDKKERDDVESSSSSSATDGLAEKLAKKLKLGKNVKVKIITVDRSSVEGLKEGASSGAGEMGGGGDGVIGDQTIAGLLSALFDNRDGKRAKQLKSKYDSVYTESSLDELVDNQELERMKNDMDEKKKRDGGFGGSRMPLGNSDLMFSIIGELDLGSPDDGSETEEGGPDVSTRATANDDDDDFRKILY